MFSLNHKILFLIQIIMKGIAKTLIKKEEVKIGTEQQLETQT